MRRSFWRNQHGGVAPLLALALMPIVGAVGAGVDYSRAAAVKDQVQAALDAAMLAGGAADKSVWQTVALNSFTSVVNPRDGQVNNPVFSQDAKGNYVGKVSGKVPAKMAGLLGYSELNFDATSVVKPGGATDNACVLTLDKNGALSHVSMLFGGAPNISLAGCSARSNTSMNCNGHGGGANASWAAGTASGCSNSQSYVRQLPDIYESLAPKITKLCGNLRSNTNWTVGTQPSSVKVVSGEGRTEYHVCGDLTVAGSGDLLGSTTDSMLVIENGSLTLDNGAAIQLSQTTLVLTGSNTVASSIQFPNGTGHTATLGITPPTSETNAFRGVSVYQDPALTYRVDNDWGPGATFNVDGVVYLPNANVELQGVAASHTNQCSKLVTGTFTTKGSVSLNFAQTSEGCKKIGMKQWSDIPTHLVQ